MVVTDRWLEMDLTWFDPDTALDPQIETLLTRIEPLWKGVGGQRGLFFNVGWLIDLVTEWTGNPEQCIPTRSRRTAAWAKQTYAQLQRFVERFRQHATRYGLADLKIGVLFVGWAHVVWPPELKIYDFDSDWYDRHPEVYDSPKSFIGMPDLHPWKRLRGDSYPYAAFPDGVGEGSYFPDFFGKQWAHLAWFLNLDAILLRDGLTGPMIYTRNGPFGTTAPADPQVVEQCSQAVRDLYRSLKQADPARLVFGYSSAISPVADWRVGCVDFEALVADGYIDAWIEQTWGGAWQDWWHQLWKGWTFQTANLLTRGVMIARANQKRQQPCKFYHLIETWDGWEPWDTLHQVPGKLRWAIWAFSHAAVKLPDGYQTPDGSYVSWLNNGQMNLLSPDDVAYLARHLNAAQASARQLEAVYGPALVYNRDMMAWLSANHPDWNMSEWVDDQAAMLMKWGMPCLSSTRMEWLPDLPQAPDALLAQTPGQLDDRTRAYFGNYGGPALAVGRADTIDETLRSSLGIASADGSLAPGFHVGWGDDPSTPPYDRPYLPSHCQITLQPGAQVHYQSAQTPLLIRYGRRAYWQPPDWSEPFNPFLPKYQLGSTFPHYRAAKLLHELSCDAGLSYVDVEYPLPVAFHLWRSGGAVHVLLGNLETGILGDARTARPVRLHLSRAQLALGAGSYHLTALDVDNAQMVRPISQDEAYLVFTLVIPPEQCAVYRLAPDS